MKLGVDCLLADAKLRAELKGKRLGLVAHPASITSNCQHSLDALMQSQDLKLKAAFGPQHGLRGEKQDNMMETEDYLDPIYQIPVFSLYGEVRRPTEHMLEQVDVILFDLQDIGTRIYTYLTTLRYMLEAAADKKKSLWILDRPNPAGRPIEGMGLKPGWLSFVGAAERIPMRHGMTLGECALWLKDALQLQLDLKVIPMQGYLPDEAPGFGWPIADLPWVNPSPNAASLSMARAFPGTVLFEGTNLSEGRGTTRPLELFGAPDIDTNILLQKMHKHAPEWLSGVYVRPFYFQPTFHKYAGKMCAGLQLHLDGPQYKHELFKPYRLCALFFKALREVQPDYSIFRDFHYEYETSRLAFDLLNGSDLLRKWIDDSNSSVSDLNSLLVKDESAWSVEREPFLLY